MQEPAIGVAVSARARVEAAARAESAVNERILRQAEETAALGALQEIQAKCNGLRAEADALSTFLSDEQRTRKPIAAELTVENGYESALSAALGDDLPGVYHRRRGNPLARSWTAARHRAGLAQAGDTLERVRARTQALARRLSQVGVVTAAEGRRCRHMLLPGQRLVSRDGGLWRWDGFFVAPGSQTPAQLRLRERNRLKAVENDLESAEKQQHECQSVYAAAQAVLQQSTSAEALAREEMRTADDALHAARDAEAEAASTAARIAADRASLDEAAKRVSVDIEEAEAQLVQAKRALAALIPDLEGRKAQEGLAAKLAERRARLGEQQEAHEALLRSMADRREKIAAIDAEFRSCEDRVSGAEERQKGLDARRTEINARIVEIDRQPADLEEKRGRLDEELARAKEARQRAAAMVNDGERGLREIEAGSRAAEDALARLREDWVRRQGALEQCTAAQEEVARAVEERLDTTPGDLIELAGLKEDDPLPDVAEVETRLKRLVALRMAWARSICAPRRKRPSSVRSWTSCAPNAPTWKAP